MRKYIFVGVVFWASLLTLFANQPEISIKPFVKLQTWNAVTQNDISTYIRRGRFGFSARISNSWSLSTCLEFDNAGKDGWAKPEGKLGGLDVGLWDAYASWRPLSDKHLFVLTTGYSLPQLSREVMTKPWFISSLEKANTSVNLRKFVTGKNNGISPFINGGGILGKDKLWFEYNLSWIQAGKHYSKENAKASIFAGRINIGLGSKPVYRYKKLSIFPSASSSVIFGVNGSLQGKTLEYNRNASYGMDVVGNVKSFKVSAEYTRMQRYVDEEKYKGSTGFCRLSYNKELKESRSVEPSLTFSALQFDNNEFGFAPGLSTALDAGVDYYCYNKTVKVSFHYSWDADHGNQRFSFGHYSTEAIVIGLQFIFK